LRFQIVKSEVKHRKPAYWYRLFAGLLSRKSQVIAIIGFVKEWKNTVNKYAKNYVSKVATYNAGNHIFEMI
jgi:hypothetical protein